MRFSTTEEKKNGSHSWYLCVDDVDYVKQDFTIFNIMTTYITTLQFKVIITILLMPSLYMHNNK